MRYARFFFKQLEKNFLFRFAASGGRNFLGRICVFHRGGGNFSFSRSLDIFRRINCFGYILKTFKEPKRTAFVGLLLYFNSLVSYVLLAEDVRPGSLLFSGIAPPKFKDFALASGFSLSLIALPMFSLIHNIELIPFKGSKYVRAAGTSALCIAHLNNHCKLKLSSGWQVLVHSQALACFGRVSNAFHKYRRLDKAGQRRWKGFRPVVRGVVKNPCDHPHGGGEGKGSPPAAQRSPWGRLTKGTPSKNKLKDRLLRRRFKNIN